jgi:hypothetical protein
MGLLTIRLRHALGHGQAPPRKRNQMETAVEKVSVWLAWGSSSLLSIFAFINPAQLLVGMSICSTTLTICYTGWKWFQDLKTKRSNGSN